MLSGVFIGSEDARNVNTNTYTNDKTEKVKYDIYSDIDSDKGSNCNMEDLYFLVDDEYMKIFTIKKKRGTSWVRIGNKNTGSKREMINKYIY